MRYTLLFLAMLPLSAEAYTITTRDFTVLNGGAGGEIDAISGGYAGGYCLSSGVTQATVWALDGSGQTLLNTRITGFNPTTTTVESGPSRIYGMNDSRAVGGLSSTGFGTASTTNPGVSWALPWAPSNLRTNYGSAYSGVSSINAASVVGGYQNDSAGDHASMWTAGARTDLTPTATYWSTQTNSTALLYADSRVNALGATKQGGYVVNTNRHTQAAIWSGSAASFVLLGDINTNLMGMTDAQQVGSGIINGSAHALLWSGTAASQVDLHPVGYSWSVANATDGVFQVGSVGQGTATHAGLWEGTAGSFIDLNTLLGSGYTKSEAISMYRSGNTLYIGGYAETQLGAHNAMMWVVSVPEPTSYGLIGASSLGVLALVRRRKRVSSTRSTQG